MEQDKFWEIKFKIDYVFQTKMAHMKNVQTNINFYQYLKQMNYRI